MAVDNTFGDTLPCKLFTIAVYGFCFSVSTSHYDQWPFSALIDFEIALGYVHYM